MWGEVGLVDVGQLVGTSPGLAVGAVVLSTAAGPRWRTVTTMGDNGGDE